jgi:predicted RNA binding protein YcfA (HicA-like mRNA interferase family)
MKSYSSREVMTMLRDDGWYEYGRDGDHCQLKHPAKKSKVTLTHPRKHIPIGTLKSIETQAGIRFS